MKRVTILIPQGGFVMTTALATYKLLQGVNGFLIESGQRSDAFFDVELVGETRHASVFDGLFSVRTQRSIRDVQATDLIVVPAIMGDFANALAQNRRGIDWIRMMYEEKEVEVASFCMGTFMLAEAGILDDKPCSTHWMAAEAFRQRYPHIDLKSERIITDEGGVCTSGGAFSFLNLLLYLIEKFCGKESAVWASKVFEIDYRRNSQTPFVIFSLQKNHTDHAIKRAQEYVEIHYTDAINIDTLARVSALSKRNFIRRFKRATGNTPFEYIQRVKMEAAKRLFESERHSIKEAMYSVGYNDAKAFRQTFRKITGLSPSEYKSKYGMEMAIS